jgi:hypothetical protein
VADVWENDGYRYLPGTRPWQMGEYEAVTCPCGANTTMHNLRDRVDFGHYGAHNRFVAVLNAEHNARRQKEMESWALVPQDKS